MNPGTELGRYTVNARIETIPGGERWTARDTTLERDVTLLIMPSDEPPTAAALDAARRASGVEAAQLVRILDVGTQERWSFIAEEASGDSDTYAGVIGDDGLPAEEVRRITGEVATGIEAARARGLHHLALTPESVLLTHDGRVKVRGLATAAALAGTETEGEDADREDATGVVALAYAGLTATWPLPGTTSLRAAPDDGSGPPPPSRVAVGVPGDLDTLCRETLTEGTGPESPGDYAAQIAPWSRIPLSGASPATPSTPPAGDEPHRRPSDAAVSAATVRTADGDVGAPGSGDDSAGSGHAARDEGATRPIDLGRDDEPTAVIDTRRRGGDDRPRGDRAVGGAHEETPPQGEDSPGKAAAAAAAAAGAVGTGAKVLGDRIGQASKSASGRSRGALHDVRARREAIRADRSRRTSLGSAPVSAELESPAPLLPADAGAAPSRQQSNLVLALMAVFVVLACVFGAIGTSQIGEGSNLGEILGGDQTTTVRTSQSSSSASSSSDGAAGDGEPFAILNAAGFDPPPGDGSEHNAEVQRVYDGNADTSWTTEGYTDPSFGGVKQGVGLTIDLGQPQQISSVTLTLPTTAEATVYAGDSATNSGTQIGTTQGRDGEVVLTPANQATAQYVTVWFTSLTQDANDGRYRAAISEISVR
ncbi:hypothetical protein [Janibacter sp. GS2]|uniref:hypothetical protein n=1 Tax=Janibacter sp. GS2 TaxID=3442646 RepID=UPI003EBC2A94